MDGSLGRLVRNLCDFCSAPLPDNLALIYGLSPSSSKLPTAPYPDLTTSPSKAFDKSAAYHFSLAFQCVVNIGVRGSEPIRSRVVQAGTLDVVGCVLEAWLTSKGFAVGPSASASGMPRERAAPKSRCVRGISSYPGCRTGARVTKTSGG